MKYAVLVAVLGVAGCGAIYTSPHVYTNADDSGYEEETSYKVTVVPLTFATVAEANLAPYTPMRLPAAFSPAPSRALPPVPGASARMPKLPEVDAAKLSRIGDAAGDLPAPATERAAPPRRVTIDLPPAAQPQPYRIGPADVVLLSADTAGATIDDVPGLLTAQSKRQGYIVQDDGAIAIPNVGRVRIGGMTLEEAEAEIFQALVEKRLDPSFSLEIAEFNSQRVAVGGRVREAGVVPITLKPLMLTEALQMSGGIAGVEPDYAVVRLFRDGRVYQAPLNALYAENGLRDVLLRDGDSVYVDTEYELDRARAYFEEQLQLRGADLREREFAFRQREAEIEEARFALTVAQFEAQKAQLRNQIAQMRIDIAEYEATRNADRRAAEAAERAAFLDREKLGAVKRDYAYLTGENRRPMRLALPFENRAYLADLMFGGEGLNIQTADFSEIYVLRGSTRPETYGDVVAYHLNAKNAVNLVSAARFEMRPSDIVFVSEQPVTTWGRVVAQLTPNLFTQAATLAVAN